MPTFSKYSLAQLETCHADLKALCNEAIKFIDFKVQEGHRGKEAQEDAFSRGATKLHYPNGNHNAIPSNAVDLWPFIDGAFIGFPDDLGKTAKQKQICNSQWLYFGGIIMGIGFEMYAAGLISQKIRWGGDFNMNNNLADGSFIDMPHFERHTGV